MSRYINKIILNKNLSPYLIILILKLDGTKYFFLTHKLFVTILYLFKLLLFIYYNKRYYE